MSIELRILAGARTGYSETFDKNVIAVGRHPMSDFKFDSRRDLDVSVWHGEIRFLDGRYTIYDAQSTNGTFVNGQRVASGGTCDLHDNDVITFGAQGPTVSVHIAGLSTGRRISTAPRRASFPNRGGPAPKPPQGPAQPLPHVLIPKQTTSERIALAVRTQTRTVKLIFVILVV